MRTVILFALAGVLNAAAIGFIPITESYGPEQVIPGYSYKYPLKPHTTITFTCTPATGALDTVAHQYGYCTNLDANPVTTSGYMVVSSTGTLPGAATCAAGYVQLAPTAATFTPGSGWQYAYSIVAVNAAGQVIGHPGTTASAWPGVVSAGNPVSFTWAKVTGSATYRVYRTNGDANSPVHPMGLVGTVADTGAATYTFADNGITAGGGSTDVMTCGLSNAVVQNTKALYAAVNLGTAGVNTFQLQPVYGGSGQHGQTVTIPDAGTGTHTGVQTNNAGTVWIVGDNGGWPTGTTFTYFKDNCAGQIADKTGAYPWDTSCILVNIPANAAAATYRAGWKACPSSTDLTTNCGTFFLDIAVVATPSYTFTPPVSIPAMPACFESNDITKCSEFAGGTSPTSMMVQAYQNWPTKDYTVNVNKDRTAGFITTSYCWNPIVPYDAIYSGLEAGGGSSWYYDGVKAMLAMGQVSGDSNWENCARNIANQWIPTHNWAGGNQRRAFGDGLGKLVNTYNSGNFAPNPPYSWTTAGATLSSAVVGVPVGPTSPLTLTMSTAHTLTQNMSLVVSGNTTYPQANGTYQIASLPPVTIALTSCSNAQPIVCLSAAPHGLTAGYNVTISGVATGTNANKPWTVQAVPDSTHFSLLNSIPNAAGTGGIATVSQSVVIQIPASVPVGALTDSLTVSTAPAKYGYNVAARHALELMALYTNLSFNGSFTNPGGMREAAYQALAALAIKRELGYDYRCNYCGTQKAPAAGSLSGVDDGWNSISSIMIQAFQPTPVALDAIYNAGTWDGQYFMMGLGMEAIIKHYEMYPNTRDLWIIKKYVDYTKATYDYTAHSTYWSQFDESFSGPPYGHGWTCTGGGPSGDGARLNFDVRTFMQNLGNANGNCGTKTSVSLNGLNALPMVFWWSKFGDAAALAVADDMFNSGIEWCCTSGPKNFNQGAMMGSEFIAYRQGRR